MNQTRKYTEHVVHTARRDLRQRLARAREREDQGRVRRLEAMKRVLDSRIIPMACPDAVYVAGEAAYAAHHGHTEATWRTELAQAAQPPPDDLDMAVRILKAADIWPWPA